MESSSSIVTLNPENKVLIPNFSENYSLGKCQVHNKPVSNFEKKAWSQNPALCPMCISKNQLTDGQFTDVYEIICNCAKLFSDNRNQSPSEPNDKIQETLNSISTYFSKLDKALGEAERKKDEQIELKSREFTQAIRERYENDFKFLKSQIELLKSNYFYLQTSVERYSTKCENIELNPTEDILKQKIDNLTDPSILMKELQNLNFEFMNSYYFKDRLDDGFLKLRLELELQRKQVLANLNKFNDLETRISELLQSLNTHHNFVPIIDVQKTLIPDFPSQNKVKAVTDTTLCQFYPSNQTFNQIPRLNQTNQISLTSYQGFNGYQISIQSTKELTWVGIVIKGVKYSMTNNPSLIQDCWIRYFNLEFFCPVKNDWRTVMGSPFKANKDSITETNISFPQPVICNRLRLIPIEYTSVPGCMLDAYYLKDKS